MKSLCRLVAIFSFAFLLLSCGKDESDPPERPGSKSDGDIIAEGGMHSVRKIKDKFEVTYQDDTVIVAEDAMRYMAPITDDYQNLEFSIEAKEHLNLEQGKVTIFPLAALGRVESVQERGDKILVKLSPAKLTDAIKDADIESVVEIGWKKLTDGSASNFGIKPAGPITISIFNQAIAADEVGVWENSITFKFTYKHVEFEFKLIPESLDKLKFEISAKASTKAHKKPIKPEEVARDFPNQRVNASNAHADYYHHDEFQPVASDGVPSGGEPSGGEWSEGDGGDGWSESLGDHLVGEIKGVAKVTGHISGLTQALDMEINDGALGKFYFDLKQLSGEMKIESVSLSGLASTINLKIPLEYSIPIAIGFIPSTLKIGAELSFRPIVDLGTSGSSQLCFMARYDGSTGFKWENGSFSNQSVVRERTAETCPDSETVSAGRVTVGMGTTAKFPSISLEIFGETLVPNLYVKLDGVTTYEPGIASAQKACQAGKEELALIFKAVLSFLGIEAETESMLWQHKKEWTCDGTVVETTFDKAGGKQKSESSR